MNYYLLKYSTLQYLIKRAFRRFTYDVMSCSYSNQQNVFNSWQNHLEKLEKRKKKVWGHVIHSPLC